MKTVNYGEKINIFFFLLKLNNFHKQMQLCFNLIRINYIVAHKCSVSFKAFRGQDVILFPTMFWCQGLWHLSEEMRPVPAQPSGEFPGSPLPSPAVLHWKHGRSSLFQLSLWHFTKPTKPPCENSCLFILWQNHLQSTTV